MKKTMLFVVVLFSFSKPAFCQWAVVDAGNIAQTLNVVKQVAAQMKFMQQQVAQMTGMVKSYQAAFAQLQNISVKDVYGNVGGLANAANGAGYGGDASYGYKNATIPLSLPKLPSLPPGALRRLQTRYGDVFMTDGSNVAAWNLIGAVRQNAQVNSKDLNRLVSDAMTSDSTVSTLMVQQKANAAAALAVQQLNTLTQVAAAQLEQSVEQSQRQRNEAAISVSTATGLQNIPIVASTAMAGISANSVPTLVF